MSAPAPPRPLLRVRSATLADLEAIVALEARSFDEPWTRASIAGFWASPGARAWLAEAGAEPVAFALFRVAAGEAELLRVATSPAWRRQQAARTLLDAALAAIDASAAIEAIEASEASAGADGAGVECHLEVRADNRAALALYGALGFELRGRRKKYYADDGDACLYTRKGRP